MASGQHIIVRTNVAAHSINVMCHFKCRIKLLTLSRRRHKKHLKHCMLFYICLCRNNFNNLPVYSGGDHWWCILCSWWLAQGEWHSCCSNCTHGFKDDGAFKWCYDANGRTNTGEGQALITVQLFIQSDYVTSNSVRVFLFEEFSEQEKENYCYVVAVTKRCLL